ncbi:MAG: molybdopterin molybdotransferase MoeA, partial [Thermoflexales bacterium]
MPASAELFTVRTSADAWALLASHLNPISRVEDVHTAQALGRVLADDVVSPEDLPAFQRSTVDGYAVIAFDTHGATAGLPALLSVVGEAPMGQRVDTPMTPGQAVGVHTGSMIPPDADAVVMVEYTQPAGAQTGTGGLPAEIEVMRPVAEGENVLQIGEDARAGGIVARRGHCLRPADIGALMALGITRLPMMARPRVGILSTGDEVIPPDRAPAAGQVRDVNAYALSALVEQAGGEAVRYGIIRDDRRALEAAAGRARSECDAV